MNFTPSYDGSLIEMNVKIDIKIPDHLIENMSKEFVDGLPKVLAQIGMLGQTYWEQLASQRLKTSRRDYMQALSYRVTGNSVEIVLGGAGSGNPNTSIIAIELGGPSYDMKPGFLNSPKAKTGKKKIPKAIADSLPKIKAKGLSKYMIVPIMPQEQTVASAANVKFRTVSTSSPAESWWHPGWKGVNLSKDVLEELNTRIIPEALRPLLEKL
jgi:hypothetical protein